jgi:hypothetical protein
MPTTICFSYPENVSPDRRRPTNSACFGYSADAPSGQRSGKTNTTCFSFLWDIPPDGSTQGPGSSGKTSSTCFGY